MHGAGRAAIFRTKGATKTTSKQHNLNYKNIFEEIGYKEDERSKQRTANTSNTKITDDPKDQFYKSDNKLKSTKGEKHCRRPNAGMYHN